MHDHRNGKHARTPGDARTASTRLRTPADLIYPEAPASAKLGSRDVPSATRQLR